LIVFSVWKSNGGEFFYDKVCFEKFAVE